MTTVTYPWPPKELTPNFKRRKHWSAYREPARLYRLACKGLTKNAHVGVAAGDVPVLMTVTFNPPDRRRRDDDGMISSFKAGRDGIADALGIDDHWFKPSYHFGDPVKGGAVSVLFGEQR